MGNLAKLLSTGNQHPRENFRVTGNLGSLNSEIIIECDGCSTVSIDLRDTFNLTIEISGTVDGNNWTRIPVIPIDVASRLYVSAIAGTTQGVWMGNCAGYWKVRARCTAFTSGTAIATLLCSNSPNPLDNLSITPAFVTTQGTAGAAATLTVSSPGTGLRHYLTIVSIERFATAALTAAATPLAITTSNIPGTLAFSFPADAATQGTLYTKSIDYKYPLAVSAQNTATTIVAPAAPNVIWRLTAGYYVAP